MNIRTFATALAAMLVLLPAAGIAQTAAPSAAASAAPSAAPSADPAVTARAKDLLHQAQTGQFDRSQLDEKMNAALTDATAKNIASQLGPLGAPVSFTLVTTTVQDGMKAYVYRVVFKDGPLNEMLVVDPKTGKITGLWFKPAQ